MNYNIDDIKENLSTDQIFELLVELRGEPKRFKEDMIVSKTICHHPIEELGDAGYKLYYYENTRLFRCYTGCSEPTYDVFELVRKVKSKELNKDYSLYMAIQFVVSFFNLSSEYIITSENSITKEDYAIFRNYERLRELSTEGGQQEVELKSYKADFLQHMPTPIIEPWVRDGISPEIMDEFEICYNPVGKGIVIPHRDKNGKLIGIRERTLITEKAERYGKYMPLKFNGKMYNHPLSFNLYGLYQNKQNIQNFKTVFVFESEKAVLQYATMFGQENNIAVAICGSSFIKYQAKLLIDLGVEHIIVGLDKQYKEFEDNEHKKLVRNLEGIHHKYGNQVCISYLFDKGELLGYKDSPTDRGKEVFLELFKNKVNIY